MSKIVFLLYYAGYVGLLSAHTVNVIWLDRLSLISLLLGCWLHAQLWKNYIESDIETVPSLRTALDLLNKQRRAMDVFVRLMPNLFSGRLLAEKNEHRFIRLSDKSLSQAARSHFGNAWEIVPVALCAVIPIWLYGVGEFHYERFYRVSPYLHSFMTHLMVAALTYVFSVALTNFFIFHSLRK